MNAPSPERILGVDIGGTCIKLAMLDAHHARDAHDVRGPCDEPACISGAAYSQPTLIALRENLREVWAKLRQRWAIAKQSA